MKEVVIGLLILIIIVLSYQQHKQNHAHKQEIQELDQALSEIDSVHEQEKSNLLKFIHTQDIHIDSLRQLRNINTRKAYEKIRMFDTVTVYYLDSFLASNYDSLARFRYGTPQAHSR